MKTGKLILQSVVVAALLFVVSYLIRSLRIKYRLSKYFPGGSLGDLVRQVDFSTADPESAFQAGCPTLADIKDALDNGCFSNLLPSFLWTSENAADGTATVAGSTCFNMDEVLVESQCSLAVLELRNQLDLMYSIDTFAGLEGDTPEEKLLAACYLDSDLYATMNEIEVPTDNGFLLGQFGYSES